MVVESHHTCFAVDVAETDENGQFAISLQPQSPSTLVLEQRVNVVFYKPGYKKPESSLQGGPTFKMAPDNRAALERMREVIGAARGMECGSEGQQRAVLLPVYRAVYAELEALAPEPTDPERVILNYALYLVERLEIGLDQALDNSTKRKKDWGSNEDSDQDAKFQP